MLENSKQRNEAAEREKIKRIIAEYLGNHLGELFDRNLEAKLPYLRVKLFNMDGYISQENHEEILNQTKDDLENKLHASQDRMNELCYENKHLMDENDRLCAILEEIKRKHKELAKSADILKMKLDRTKEELICVREEGENKIKEYERYLKMEQERIREELKKSEDVAELYREKVAYYKNNYASLDEAYKKYLDLDENMRHQLAGIFGKGDTVQGFFCGAVHEAHLKSLWEFICHGINNHRWDENIENNLKGLFDFAFDAVSRGGREPAFLRIETQKGVNFDMSTMQRTSDSRQLGRVQKVLLEGYKNRVGTVIVPSLVVIG